MVFKNDDFWSFLMASAWVDKMIFSAFSDNKAGFLKIHLVSPEKNNRFSRFFTIFEKIWKTEKLWLFHKLQTEWYFLCLKMTIFSQNWPNFRSFTDQKVALKVTNVNLKWSY